jgi:iron(II)-dependent oxidoreductase
VELNTLMADRLEAARRRSLDLLAPVPDDGLVRQHSPLMSPLVWDLAHVGNYEEQWLLRALGGRAVGERWDSVYDAFRHPRRDRPSLPMMGPAEARSYVAVVRGEVLDLLERLPLDSTPAPTTVHRARADGSSPSQSHPPPATELVPGAFVHGMVVQHEHQHIETMLATLNLAQVPDWQPAAPDSPSGVGVSGEVLVDGGPFVMGTDAEPWAYDNERPAHVVDLAAFRIDAAPVTNGDYLSFVESRGYHDPRWWSPAGWAWREESGLTHPGGWSREGPGSWSQTRFGCRQDLVLAEPVEHVCWYEADAFARWCGKRLPTEAEWEKAASWGPDGRTRAYPWGGDEPTPARANLGQRHLGPAPVGAYPGGTSPWGCHQMIGDVWEWTASDFLPHPGFASFPYREYSEVFYGHQYKVLRGGSWATHPTAVRTTFRNWDYPIRRQIFSGFRCARDA